MKAVLYKGESHGGLYPIPFSCSLVPRIASSTIMLSSHIWHPRLGHPSHNAVKEIVTQRSLPCLSFNKEPSICEACHCSKSHQQSYTLSTCVSTKPLQLMHTDIWGPALTSFWGYRYYVSLVDDFSHFCWIYLIKNKSDVENIFYAFQAHVEHTLNHKICAVQSDGGGEYTRLNQYF